MKRILTLISTLLVVATASAQYLDMGGTAIDPHTPSAMDLFNISYRQWNNITARSAAMGGAFTSLGGDIASMSINPAGIGMYTRHDIALTPLVSLNHSQSSGEKFEHGRRHKFGVGNFGAVFNLRESATGIMAINVGVAYNRLADFNYRYSTATSDQRSSIADVYARNLQRGGYTANRILDDYDLLGNSMFSNIDPSAWGSVLGFLSGMTDDRQSGGWERDMIGQNARVAQFTTVESGGSLGEYLISLGMNINNKVYVGASVGVQSLTMTRRIYYGENYLYDSDPGLDYRMDYFNSDQKAQLSGVGFDFKIGITYRPFEALRLGFAIHTPSFFSLSYTYDAGMTSQIKSVGGNPKGYPIGMDGYIYPPFSYATPTLKDSGDTGWKAITPTRLLFGASYTFGQQGVISVDYECDLYNGIRVKGSPYGEGIYGDFIKDNFKAAHALRIGGEWRVTPRIALRAGYGLWLASLSDKNAVFSSPIICETHTASAGVGFRLSRVTYLDFTYQYNLGRMTDYATFYGVTPTEDIASPLVKTTLHRHIVMLTLGFRF